MKTCSYFVKGYDTASPSYGCIACGNCSKDYQHFSLYCNFLDIPSCFIKLNSVGIPYVTEKGCVFQKERRVVK